MNKFIEKINFKKIVIIYLALLILVILGIVMFLGNIYNDKIQILYNYHKLYEVVEKNYNQEILKDKINSLSRTSKNIIDIVIINNNDIIYTTKNFYENKLTSINNTNNYYIDSNKNIYKLDTKDEFILDLFNIKKENKSDYYNEFQINTNNDNMYIINYLKNEYSNDKIVIVTKISSIENSKIYLKISLSILTLFFMLYWIIVALMIYQNALKLKINAYFWGIITLLSNFIGVIAYLVFIKNRTTCQKCHTYISINDNYCKSCGEKI